MIQTFANQATQEFFETGESRVLPPDILRRALRKLEYVDNAVVLSDLRMPPGNRLHALKGNCQGQHAIAINDQWRICFRFEDDGVFDVEICDYH